MQQKSRLSLWWTWTKRSLRARIPPSSPSNLSHFRSRLTRSNLWAYLMALDPRSIPNKNQNSPSGLPDRPRLSDYQLDERAAEAKAILDNSVFRDALDDVYSRALGTLLNADIGSLTASTAHATMKAIRDVRSQLEQYVMDKKMREKFGNKGE